MAYNKTTWSTGDVISADKLNNAESGIETASLASDLPRVDLTGDTTAMTGDVAVPLQFRFRDGQQDVLAYASTKWQGDTSQGYPKKNLSFKFYSDSDLSKKLKWKPKSSWKKDNSFNLKANWIDRTEARNLVNAQIQAQTFASTPLYYGNANSIPANYSQVEANKAVQFLFLDSFIDKDYLSQQLTLSCDVQLVEDNGTGNNEAKIYFTSKANTDSGAAFGDANTIDLSSVAVGSSSHYTMTFTPAAGYWFDKLIMLPGTVYSTPTAHILVKNISLTATSTDPGTYAPSVADNHAMLASAANYGAIQGFPVEMYLNGVDQGLYTFNTRKDNNLMNMDSSNNSHILIDVETITLNESAYALNGVDGSVITPDATADVIAAFNRLAQFVNESADADFVAQIAQYVDLYSVIDTAILRLAMENIDGDGKSILYGTYDGRTWFTVPYDLDSTWQLYFDGSNIQPLWNAGHFYFSSKLLSRVINLFPTQVKKRYIKLRQRTLSAGNINKLFKDFIDGIPTIAFDNNETIWPAIPSIQLTDFAQIQQSVTGCLSVADKMLNAQIVSTADGSVVDTSGQPQ